MSKSNAAAPAPEIGAAEHQSEPRALCLCGCGGTPKGPKSRFIPGHDARYHAAQKRGAAPAKPTEKPKTNGRPRGHAKTAAVKDGATETLPVKAEGRAA